MNCSHPDQQVQDIRAFNSNKQRVILFDDAQSRDTENNSLENSLNIHVQGNGNGQSSSNEWLDSNSDDMGIENLADNEASSQQHDSPIAHESSGPKGQQLFGNYLNIDVSGINVQAINTVQGGSAVATSNIEIKPVQIINCPDEVEEKLK